MAPSAPKWQQMYLLMLSVTLRQPPGNVTARLPSKQARLSSAGSNGLAKSGVSPSLEPLVFHVYRVCSHRDSKVTQKMTIQHARPWLWASGPPKKGPGPPNLSLYLDQQPETARAQRRKDDHLNLATHLGGLGANHAGFCAFMSSAAKLSQKS